MTPVAVQGSGGTTTVGDNIIESTRLAMGWTVNKTLMMSPSTTMPARRSASW